MNTLRCKLCVLTVLTAATFLAGGCGGDPPVNVDSGMPIDSAVPADATLLDAPESDAALQRDMAMLDATQIDAALLDAGSDAGPALSQQAYVKASNTDGNDSFGCTVALSADGHTLAVGASNEDSNATGVGGAEANDSAASAGAVYVFTRTGEAWTQQAYIKASNTGRYDYFGASVSLSADGNTLVVGAPGEESNAAGVGGNQADNSLLNAGAVYVFTRSGIAWTQNAYAKASNTGAEDRFGDAVSISADGHTLAIGTSSESSNARGIGGDQADNSAMRAGAVYVFTGGGGDWTQEAYIKASNSEAFDVFGESLSLSSDGDTLAVGASSEASNATGIGGNQSDNSVYHAGAVYVFTRSGIAWTQQAYVKASNTGSDAFGRSVSLSADGNVLAVGAYGESSSATGVDGDQADDSAPSAGAVYMFVRSGIAWTQDAYVKGSNSEAYDMFGFSVSLSADGNTLAVRAASEDSSATGVAGNQADNSASDSGAVYVFAHAGDVWVQHAYVKASNPDSEDWFGSGLSLSADGRTLSVGAFGEASNATGIDGDQLDNSATNAGATYIFAVP